MKKVLIYFYSFCSLLFIISATSCKRSTPSEMLFGQWKIVKVVENSFDVTDQYINSTNAYIVLKQQGTYQLGLLDSTAQNSWVAYPEENQLVLLDDGIIDEIKKWDIVAADNSLQLKYPTRGLIVSLERVESLPVLNYKQPADLVGKWVIDKVTINGTNSTSTYAYPDRWIIIAKNGRFYNGQAAGNQNSGYWQTDESLTTLDFRISQNFDSPALTFHIARENIWYEKEKDVNDKNSVKIFFKKVDG